MPVHSSRNVNANGQTFSTWLEHSAHLATIREVSGRYGLDCQELEMKQAEQWTLRLLGVVSDMDKQTFESNGEQFDYMDGLSSLNNIDFAKQRSDSKAKANINPNSSPAHNPSPTRSKGNSVPTSKSSQNRTANTAADNFKSNIQQPRVTIPSTNFNMHQYRDDSQHHSGQSPFSASSTSSSVLSPSSTYSVATPISIASPQTPWLHQHDEQEHPMGFLAPDPYPQSFPPSNFTGGIQYPASTRFQHQGPVEIGYGSSQYQTEYSGPSSYMDQQQMDYILDTRSNFNFADIDIDNKHGSGNLNFKYPNSNNHTHNHSHNAYAANNNSSIGIGIPLDSNNTNSSVNGPGSASGMKTGPKFEVGNTGIASLARSPKGQMQWVNTYFEDYPYTGTDAGTNTNVNTNTVTNMQLDINTNNDVDNNALHSNIHIGLGGGNAMYNQSTPTAMSIPMSMSMSMSMPMRIPTIPMASSISVVGNHDVHAHTHNYWGRATI